MDNSKIVEINGKKVDLSNAIPIKVGDMRKLASLGVDLTEFKKAAEEESLPDMNQTANLLFHFAQKCNPEITLEDIDELEITDMADVINKIFDESKEADPDPNS